MISAEEYEEKYTADMPSETYDLYSITHLHSALEEDEISAEDAAFMEGYIGE